MTVQVLHLQLIMGGQGEDVSKGLLGAAGSCCALNTLIMSGQSTSSHRAGLHAWRGLAGISISIYAYRGIAHSLIVANCHRVL